MRPAENETQWQQQVAESYGAEAERYDRTRPRYPDAMVERIVATSPGRKVLDIGVGTGIAARAFQAADCQVLGVEPDERMADVARHHGLDVEIAKFEDWDPRGRVFDTVIAGTAWHWIDPVAGADKAAQALRPAGRLAPFWNAFQPAPEVAKAFAAVYAQVLPDSPIYQRGMIAPDSYAPDSYADDIAKASDGIKRSGKFSEPEQWQFGWERTYTREEWLDQLPTYGAYSQLPAAELEALLTGIGNAIDSIGGSFTMHYTALVLTAVRSDAP
jgi:SAM-dependent methyltransferase